MEREKGKGESKEICNLNNRGNRRVIKLKSLEQVPSITNQCQHQNEYSRHNGECKFTLQLAAKMFYQKVVLMMT